MILESFSILDETGTLVTTAVMGDTATVDATVNYLTAGEFIQIKP